MKRQIVFEPIWIYEVCGLLVVVLVLIHITTLNTYFQISRQTKLPIKTIKKLIKVNGTDIKCRTCGAIIFYPSLHMLHIRNLINGYMKHFYYTPHDHPIQIKFCCKLKKPK